jgi:hypothetical protein
MCEGWSSHSCGASKRRCGNEYWHYHNANSPLAKCVDSFEKRTIKYRAIPQLGNPYYGNPPIEMTLHCAQRLYPLYNTHFKINATSTLLMNTDDLREKETFKLQQEVMYLVAQLASDGVDEITGITFQQEVKDNLDKEIELRRLERMLGAIGVEKTLENGVNKFQFGDWGQEYLEA